MLNVIFCDDDVEYMHSLRAEVQQHLANPNYESLEFNLVSFSDALTAEDYIRHNEVAVCFLDIEMPNYTGFELAKRGLEPSPKTELVQYYPIVR